MRAGLAQAIPYNTHLGSAFGADRDASLAELERDGRVRFPVTVDLTNEAGETVAEVTVRWYVRKNS
jgi:hypothetical protein